MAKPTYPVILAATSLTSGIVAAWPLNEGTGNARDVVAGVTLDCSGSGVSWNASPLGLLTVGTPSRASVATPAGLKLFPSSQPSITVLWVGERLGTCGNPGGLAGVRNNSTDEYEIYFFPTSLGYACVSGQNGSATINTATIYNVVLRQNIGLISGFINGAADRSAVTNNQSGGITYGGTSVIFLGTLPGFSVAANWRHDLLVFWNRSISDPEVASMVADPWQLFVPAPSAAGGAALLPAM
jgi:hypothetical protein